MIAKALDFQGKLIVSYSFFFVVFLGLSLVYVGSNPADAFFF